MSFQGGLQGPSEFLFVVYIHCEDMRFTYKLFSIWVLTCQLLNTHSYFKDPLTFTLLLSLNIYEINIYTLHNDLYIQDTILAQPKSSVLHVHYVLKLVM